MLIYGDHTELVDPAEWLAVLADEVRTLAAAGPGIDRHSRLVGALVRAGQLWQAIADEGFACRNLAELVQQLASCTVCSFDSGFKSLGRVPAVPAMEVPARLHLRLPEGFAFYAVYPEAYIEAARKLRLVGPPRVIGIRSIGTTLGAVVAAAIGAPPPVTIRPFGHPFAREVNLPPETIEADAHYIIVDEGPGLSGSSFGSVADWLEARSVPLGRIAFLPSHSADPGEQASEVHRERWRRAQRMPAEFDPAFLVELLGPLSPFNGGGPWQRTKFRAADDGGALLAKFAGLGAMGERKLQMARALHAAGFSPEPLRLVHGFLIERWRDDAHPLGPKEKPIEAAGRYLAARARLFPAPEASGASIQQLLTMCRRNIALALGEEAVGAIDRFDADSLSARVRRVRTDNKMALEEWLRTRSGAFLKTDALDHHCAHDLVGCQGIEWDVAGAVEEFRLDSPEQQRLIEATGLGIDPELLGFYRVAYAAFRLGQSELGGEKHAAQRYAESLKLLLHQNS